MYKKINLLYRRFMFKFHMMFTNKHDYEKQVKLICKYDTLDILN
jgi:hypothetical protein